MPGLDSISPYIWSNHGREPGNDSDARTYEFEGRQVDVSSILPNDHPGGPEVLGQHFRLDGPMKAFHRADNVPEALRNLPAICPGLRPAYATNRPRSPDFFKASPQNATTTDAIRFDKGAGVFRYADGRAAEVPRELQDVCREFHAKVEGKATLPCKAAKAASEKSLIMSVYDHPMGDPRNNAKAMADLSHMESYKTGQHHHHGNYYTTLVMIFRESAAEPAEYGLSDINSKDIYKLHQELSASGQLSKGRAPASDQVSGYALVDMGPDAPRASRKFRYRAVACNPDDQFSYLRDTDQIGAHEYSTRRHDRLFVSKSELPNPGLPEFDVPVPQHTLQEELGHIRHALSVPEWSSHHYVARRLLTRLATRLGAMPERRDVVRGLVAHRDAGHLETNQLLASAMNMPVQDRKQLYSLLVPALTADRMRPAFDELKKDCMDSPDWLYDGEQTNIIIAKLATYIPAMMDAGIDVDELVDHIDYRGVAIGKTRMQALTECYQDSGKQDLADSIDPIFNPDIQGDEINERLDRIYELLDEPGLFEKPLDPRQEENIQELLELIATCARASRNPDSLIDSATSLARLLGPKKTLAYLEALPARDSSRLLANLFKVSGNPDESVALVRELTADISKPAWAKAVPKRI